TSSSVSSHRFVPRSPKHPWRLLLFQHPSIPQGHRGKGATDALHPVFYAFDPHLAQLHTPRSKGVDGHLPDAFLGLLPGEEALRLHNDPELIGIGTKPDTYRSGD